MSKPNALPYRFPEGQKVRLGDIPGEINNSGFNKATAYEKIAENVLVMAEHAKKLYAENRRSILLVLQGMDTAGKDGTIRSVMRGMNPTSCQVHSFKKPSEEELDHDFLWRVHKVVPRRGNIGIFNRSHYEDVLVVRVHGLVPKDDWKPRFELINDFEKLLVSCHTEVVKCFLHISKDTQRERLQARLDDPRKHWKFNMGDLTEAQSLERVPGRLRRRPDKMQYEYAPWHIIPSDRKWYRNLVISELLRKTLDDMSPRYPDPDANYEGVVVE